ncbi:hypothetical protein OROHE_016745 [Orobanche hederae]
MEEKNIELRLRTFGAETSKNDVFLVVNTCSSKDHTNNVVGVCFAGQDITDQKVVMDKFISVQGDYKGIVHSPSPLIPPIFASDLNTCCYEWNAAMESLTGWSREEIIGKMLIGEIVGNCCRLNGLDAITNFMIVLHNAIGGQDTEKFPFSFSDRNGKYVRVLLTANKRVNMDGGIVGAFCFLQIVNTEMQKASGVDTRMEKCVSKMKDMAYVVQQIKNLLNGIHFTNAILEATNLTEVQRLLLETSAACEKQMLKVVKDVDLENIEDGETASLWGKALGSVELEKAEFVLGSVIEVVSQVMLLVRERGLQLVRDIPDEVKMLTVYGDQARIQQVLADFLLNMVRHAASPDRWVELQLRPSLKQVSEGINDVNMEFRIVCPGEGLDTQLVQDIFHNSQWATREGLGLSMPRRLLKLMNGEV